MEKEETGKEKKKRKYVKKCFVPTCYNNSVKTPNKIFVTVPKSFPRRKLWFDNVGRQYPEATCPYFCCEDHFDLQQDTTYYYKLCGGNVKLKPGVVPRISGRNPDSQKLDTCQKQKQQEKIAEILSEHEKQTTEHLKASTLVEFVECKTSIVIDPSKRDPLKDYNDDYNVEKSETDINYKKAVSFENSKALTWEEYKTQMNHKE